jgi:type I restriction enzyme S subunit
MTNSVYDVPMGWRLFSVDQIKSPDQYSCVAGPFGSSIASKFFVDDGVPVIRGSNLRDDLTRFVDDHFVFISEEKAASFRAQQTRPGDLVFTCWGTIGQVGIVPEGLQYDRFVISNKQLKLRVDPHVADPLFCFYYFASPRYVQYIRGRNIGGAVPGINLGILKSFPIALPSVSEQKRIATILSLYDELIDNNRRRIELLEQSAGHLFKEWFVRLRYPGHEHDKVVDGVPEGWRLSTTEEVCIDFVDGDWLETKDQGGDSFRILQISNIGANSFVETGNFRYITDETFRRLNCTEVVSGDILISRMPEPIGRAWLVTPQAWRMVTAVDVTIARPDLKQVESSYFLHHLNSSIHLAHCAARATGTTRPRIAKRVMGGLPILIPPMSLQKEFADFAAANNALRERLTRQCGALGQARDLLLPRLMDGRISV